MQTSNKGMSREDIEFYKNFVAPTPSRILTATRSGVTVVTKLFGEITPERLDREQRETDHRAEQLAPVPKRPERFERDPVNQEPGVYIGDEEARDMMSRRRFEREIGLGEMLPDDHPRSTTGLRLSRVLPNYD